MTIWSLLGLGILACGHLTGFLVLVWCARGVPEGYEDTDGFHFGGEPLPRSFTDEHPADKQWEHADWAADRMTARF
jgi:hypothetical protein